MRTVLVGAAVAGAAAFAPSAMPGANIRVRAVAAPQLRAASARRAQVRPLKIPATDPMPIPPISKTTGRGEDTRARPVFAMVGPAQCRSRGRRNTCCAFALCLSGLEGQGTQAASIVRDTGTHLRADPV